MILLNNIVYDIYSYFPVQLSVLFLLFKNIIQGHLRFKHTHIHALLSLLVKNAYSKALTPHLPIVYLCSFILANSGINVICPLD